MYTKKDSTDAIKAFLSRGGSIKRIDTPSEAERIAKAMAHHNEKKEISYDEALALIDKGG